jgi:uncharacterized protein (DUF924 family)
MTAPASASGATEIGPEDVLAFWRAAGADKWFEKDPAFDAEITTRFAALRQSAIDGKLAAWEATPDAALALVIVIDQFSRNMFRGNPRTYQADPLARAIADRALARGFDQQVAYELRPFFYLPFMHSENLADQERCCELARRYGDAEHLKYAEDHADIIRRFGRFPHRNAMLGRTTTAPEQAFLDDGGFAG